MPLLPFSHSELENLLKQKPCATPEREGGRNVGGRRKKTKKSGLGEERGVGGEQRKQNKILGERPGKKKNRIKKRNKKGRGRKEGVSVCLVESG